MSDIYQNGGSPVMVKQEDIKGEKSLKYRYSNQIVVVIKEFLADYDCENSEIMRKIAEFFYRANFKKLNLFEIKGGEE